MDHEEETSLESKAAKSLASILGRLNAAMNRGYQNKRVPLMGVALQRPGARRGWTRHVQQNYFTLPDAVEG